MTDCRFSATPDVELYFYGELDAADRAALDAHLRACAGCTQRLDDLRAISAALAERPHVSAPPAGDWSGFMRRLDAACGAPNAQPTLAATSTRRRFGLSLGIAAAAAAAIVLSIGLVFAMLSIGAAHRQPVLVAGPTAPKPAPPAMTTTPASADKSLREVTAEHLERSKLVVLGLTTLDPAHAKASDWQYERKLAGNLLTDTRLYRMAAQERGMNDVAHVMRDLETVLIETSMSDNADRDALGRLQKLIAKRDLVMKMQLVSANASGL
jgi:hypothetical protein